MKRSEKGITFLSFFLPAAMLLLLLLLNVCSLSHWLDSDMAAEMIFSKNLAEEGRLFATPGWYYSTEFRVLYTQLFMVPLFHILEDWHVIRLVTNMGFYILLLGSYYFMMKPLNISRKWVLLTSAVLLMPFSETMMTHMQMGNTYMSHVIIVFICFGLFLRLSREAAAVNHRKRAALRGLYLTAYLLLSVICGMSGVRYMLALQCPLALAAVVYMLKQPAFGILRQEVSLSNGRQLFGGASGRYVLYSMIGAGAAVAGYGINSLVIARQYSFQTYEATNFISIYQGIMLDRMQDTFGSLLMLFGYIPDKGFLSVRGLISLCAFVLLGLGIYVTVRSRRFYREKAKEAEEQYLSHRQLVGLFFVIAFCVNTFVFIFTTSTLVPRYYITVVVFFLPLLAGYMEKEVKPLDRILVVLVLGGCLALGTAKTAYSFISTDKNADKQDVIAFLQDKGYSFGYATYWNGNIITELTDGQIETANIVDPESMAYFKWSSPKKYYEEQYHQGKTFLLLTAEETQQYEDADVVKRGTKLYEDAYYTVWDYESTEAVLEGVD